jgi:1-deoxy-D-xylulose-5-phosphate reductoisomerase
MSKTRLIILGSTGSIGTQALDVIRTQRDRFEVVGLTANENATLLQRQAHEFGVENVALARGESDPLVDLVQRVDADLVLVALTGISGVLPTLASIRSGKNIALANKETLVMGGQIVMEEAAKHNVQIIPVDSEHSAIFQCLQGVNHDDIEKIILTCSGGAFRGMVQDQLLSVTAEDALRHPTWSMGKKITIDCATLVNKGFEIIEAHHLFDLSYDQIEVRLHPQSKVHGIVQLKDGNTLMHLSPPDMRIPINYALNYPNRIPLDHDALKLTPENLLNSKLEFGEVDHHNFPGIKIAYEVGRQGGLAPAIFNTANDRAVQQFLDGEISFLDIYDHIQSALRDHKPGHSFTPEAITDLITASL